MQGVSPASIFKQGTYFHLFSKHVALNQGLYETGAAVLCFVGARPGDDNSVIQMALGTA